MEAPPPHPSHCGNAPGATCCPWLSPAPQEAQHYCRRKQAGQWGNEGRVLDLLLGLLGWPASC